MNPLTGLLTRQTDRNGWATGCAGLILAVGLVAQALPAWALSGSTFEGNDGNLVVDDTGSIDWASLVGSPALRIGDDAPSGQTDDSFQAKEDDTDPTVTYGSIPKNKSDLQSFYVAHQKIDVGGDARDFLYLAWSRNNILGTGLVDFEFNQAKALSANGITPQRTPGDALITFAFGNGGSAATLGLSRWTDTGACEESGATPPCWGPIEPLAGIAEGAVNTGDVFDAIAGITHAGLTFGEAMIDMTAAGVFDTGSCTSFGSVYVKSRSSDSFTASLKDFIRPIAIAVSNCATVTIHKDAVPDDPQAFTFVPSAELNPTPFELADDGSSTSSQTFIGRFSGAFTVAELAAAGWDLTDLVCSAGGTAVRDGEGLLTGEVVLDVGPGDAVDCTFTNTKRGHILVDVVTDPAGEPQVFDLTLKGGPAPVSDSFALSGAAPPYDSDAIEPGLYSLAQVGSDPQWDLTGITCDDGSPATAIALDPGETVTCTVTNTKRGEIVVDVATDPAGDPQPFAFTLTAGPSALDQAFSLTDQSAAHASGFLLPGTGYAAVETLPPGWYGGDATCSNGSAATNIAVAPGEVVTCTFTNAKMGRIRIDKATQPAGDDQSFAFALSGGPSNLSDTFTLTDTAIPHDSGFLVPGPGYAAEELLGKGKTAVTDWDLTGLSCTSTLGASHYEFSGARLDPATFQAGDTKVTIDLAVGDEVTCTITNTKRGAITVVKDALPDGPQDFDFTLSGPELSTSFRLDDDGDETDNPHKGQLPSTATFTSLVPGSYTVREADAGIAWDSSRIECRDSQGALLGSADLTSRTASFILPPGEHVTCLFNDTQRGTIVTEKSIPEEFLGHDCFDAGQQPFAFATSYGDEFALKHGEIHESSLLPAGESYTVSESTVDGWFAASVCTYPDGTTVDGGADAQISLPPAGMVHCVFTNRPQIHPGSKGFWKNWDNHYTADEFAGLLYAAFQDAGIYADLFYEDLDSGDWLLVDEAIALFDAIHDFQGGASDDQAVLAEDSAARLNLAVSTSPAPEISGLQMHHDISRDCMVDVSDIPGAQELIEAWTSDLILGSNPTIGAILDVAEQTWTGTMADWAFDLLTDDEKRLLNNILEQINTGRIVDVDICSYPDAPTCRTVGGLSDGTVGMVYGETIVVSGGTPPYTWAITAGSLPPGLELDTATGDIKGTPVIDGTFAFTVEVTDGSPTPKTGAWDLEITIHPAPAITTTALPDGTMGSPYTTTVEMTGGNTPVIWSLVEGALPEGLGIDPGTGVISGTPPMAKPAKPRTSTFTLRVTDSAGATDTTVLGLTINPPL
jgi:hypothetical protein